MILFSEGFFCPKNFLHCRLNRLLQVFLYLLTREISKYIILRNFFTARIRKQKEKKFQWKLILQTPYNFFPPPPLLYWRHYRKCVFNTQQDTSINTLAFLSCIVYYLMTKIFLIKPIFLRLSFIFQKGIWQKTGSNIWNWTSLTKNYVSLDEKSESVIPIERDRVYLKSPLLFL